jgi:hypothetical protein
MKRMKAASASSQFYTTIVVKVCVTCREWIGCVAADRRASFIFKKVECGLRDRVAFPLPSNVTIKNLMANSYFQGNDAEANFRKFCADDGEPVTGAMIDIGNRLYNNKFTDIKKLITNHVLPKFLSIYKDLTGSDGSKSGYVVDINLVYVIVIIIIITKINFCNKSIYNTNTCRYNSSAQDSLCKANRILHEVSCHTSHLTTHTTNFTPHARHTSHVAIARHMSHSHVILRMSHTHVTRRTSHRRFTPETSHVAHTLHFTQELFHEHAEEPLKTTSGYKYYTHQDYDPQWEQLWYLCLFEFSHSNMCFLRNAGGIFGAQKCSQVAKKKRMTPPHFHFFDTV